MPVPMRDGTVLRANVYRPAGRGRWPVLLTRLPYGKDLPLGTAVLDPVQAARRGYVVVVQDTRGRFASDGDWVPLRREAEDGVDTIGWAAALPYGDGQVGMYGASYFGFTQWSAAVQAPPALKAMVPFITWADPLNGLIFRGGAFELGVQADWNLRVAFDVLVRRHRGDPKAMGDAFAALAHELDHLAGEGYSSLPLTEFEPLRKLDVAPNFFEAFELGPDPKAADFATIAGKHEHVQVPTLNVGGWYDIFLQDTLANHTAMKALGRPSQVLIGPWTHGTQRNPVGELSFGFGSQAAFIDLRYEFGGLQLRWFDHWLKGAQNGVPEDPPVKIFVMGVNRWRSEAEWPLARATTVRWHLRGEGGLSPEPPAAGDGPDAFTYDPADPVPTRGGALLIAPDYPAGPVDQRPVEARPDVLCYTSAPMESDLEVTGPVRLRLWAASDAPSTDFVARLCDVHPDGRSFNLTDGILRLTNLDGAEHELWIDLWSTSNVFRRGHRIRLQVTSSCFPRWDRNLNTGRWATDAAMRPARQTVFHDARRASYLELPEVPLIAT
ncbi:MAG TPA: CocE/NonD family hydrolase [Candidatus Acidoferrales bacterium]|nr:CocE/NonD family hydrolase [Candidatus Acidoferrales bacterium]